VPAGLDLPWVAMHDWRGVCPDTRPLVRLDPWDCRATFDLHGPEERLLIPPTGAAVVRLLLEAWGAVGEIGVLPGWLQLACESFFVDYRWGPDYAWQRLQQSCWRNWPASRRTVLAPVQAERLLEEAFLETFVQLRGALEASTQFRGRPLMLISGLFHRPEIVRLAQGVLGGQVTCAAISWVDGLARLYGLLGAPHLPSAGR